MTLIPTPPDAPHSVADQDALLGEVWSGVRSPNPGDVGNDLAPEGRFGNLMHNLTSRSQVQNRCIQV